MRDSFCRLFSILLLSFVAKCWRESKSTISKSVLSRGIYLELNECNVSFGVSTEKHRFIETIARLYFDSFPLEELALVSPADSGRNGVLLHAR